MNTIPIWDSPSDGVARAPCVTHLGIYLCTHLLLRPAQQSFYAKYLVYWQFTIRNIHMFKCVQAQYKSIHVLQNNIIHDFIKETFFLLVVSTSVEGIVKLLAILFLLAKALGIYLPCIFKTSLLSVHIFGFQSALIASFFPFHNCHSYFVFLFNFIRI